jgi:hypothetical protein
LLLFSKAAWLGEVPSPIYDYIPTWYHEFIYTMQCVLSLSLDIPFYRFLITIFALCFLHFLFFGHDKKIGNFSELRQQHT